MDCTLSDKHGKPTTETITAASYIATLLQRLVTDRLLLTVSVATDNAPSFTSTVLQVHPNEGILLLDELFPQHPAAQLVPGDPISINATFDGAGLSFTTTVESLREEAGLRLWQLTLPTAVEYQQARNEHRVEVASLVIPVRLFVGEGVVLKGQLHDLCPQGVGLRLEKIAGVKRGKAYRCSIDHSDEESVEIEIEPSRAVKASGPLPVELGATLHNMSRHDMGQWQRFVTEMERRLLRRQ